MFWDIIEVYSSILFGGLVFGIGTACGVGLVMKIEAWWDDRTHN